jgi:hypothetical protein
MYKYKIYFWQRKGGIYLETNIAERIIYLVKIIQ